MVAPADSAYSHARFSCCGGRVPRKWSGESHLCEGSRSSRGAGLRIKMEPKAPPGSDKEAALYAALAESWNELSPGTTEANDTVSWLRQYPWGAFLNPPRRFTFDAAFPYARLGVEVEGQVHSIKGKRKGDVVRRQLAESNGWRVLSVLPEQVRDGSAVDLVRLALAVAYSEAKGA